MSALPVPTFRPTVDGSVSVPLDLLKDRSLIHTDLAVALALTAGLAGADAVTWASNEELCALTGLRRRAVQESLQRLNAAGWVYVSVAGGNRASGRKRAVTLCWRMPDPFTDCRYPTFGGKPPRPGRGGAL
jgi:hypothetical protein